MSILKAIERRLIIAWLYAVLFVLMLLTVAGHKPERIGWGDDDE